MDIPLNLANASSKQLPFVKKSLRDKIPYLTIQQIRRLKLPLPDAMTIELEEGNFKKALPIFQEILDIDKCHKKCFSGDENLNLLEEIFNSLKGLEDKTGEEELMILVEIIKKICIKNEMFDWLTELLLIKGSQLGANCQLEETKSYTILAYLHGLSLSHRLHWYHAALLQLELAYKNALNNDDWIFEDEVFCVKISQELSDCLIKLSKEIRVDQNNPQESLIYARRALKVLRKTLLDKNLKMEIDSETEIGNCLLHQRLFDEAKAHFEHALGLSEKCELKQNFCESLIAVAKCYKGLGDFKMCEELLYIANEHTAENSLLNLKGNILIMLMEIYVEHLDVDKIREIFDQAFDCFVMMDDEERLLEVEILSAHAGAKLTFNKAIDLILKSDKSEIKDDTNLQKLINWIDQKNSKELETEESEDKNIEEFIRIYYDPDEITKLNLAIK